MTEDQKQTPVSTGWFKRFYRSFWGETLQVAVIAILIIVPFRMYIAQPFMVSGKSMDDTFNDGEYLIVDELTYHFKEPARGEVVVFHYPLNKKLFFIKRIIGLPGETIEIKKDQVKIFNQANPQGWILDEPYIKNLPGQLSRPDLPAFTLKNDEYFVMGDNREFSSDSRIWGPVKFDQISGRTFLRLFPLSRLDLFPGFN